jgi:hypothetical protein
MKRLASLSPFDEVYSLLEELLEEPPSASKMATALSG